MEICYLFSQFATVPLLKFPLLSVCHTSIQSRAARAHFQTNHQLYPFSGWFSVKDVPMSIRMR